MHRSRQSRAAPVLLLTLLVMALGGAIHPREAKGQGTASSASLEDAPGAMVLRPGDALQVSIWREKDLSGEFVVDNDGVVTLPLLGRVTVTGMPFPDLHRELVERYGKELRNPSIEITPLLRIYVLGHVNEPGLLSVDPTITLAGAVALAGGANEAGDLDKLRIVRDGNILLKDPGPELDLQRVDIRSGDQIFVDRRGWFERNSVVLVSAIIGSAGIIVQLLR